MATWQLRFTSCTDREVTIFLEEGGQDKSAVSITALRIKVTFTYKEARCSEADRYPTP